MAQIILRKFCDNDELEIKRITELCYYKIFEGYSKDKISVILKDNVSVGWIYLDLPESSLYSGFVFIYVAQEYRRKGIGTYAYRQAATRFGEIGCNLWSSYPELEAADQFAVSVGFDYTNINCYLVHDGSDVSVCTDGIRVCRVEDYPIAPDLWSREYAAMHVRIGLPYKKKELSDDERKEEYEDILQKYK